MSEHKIVITEHEGKVGLALSPDMGWELALNMLVSTIRSLANLTVDMAAAKHRSGKAEVRRNVSADLADNINFAISNVLNELSPRDPDAQLSEMAIATLENEIIHRASKKHITLQQALSELENELSCLEHAVKPIGQNGPRKHIPYSRSKLVP